MTRSRPFVLFAILLTVFVGLDLDAFGQRGRSPQRSSPSRSSQSRSTPSRSPSRSATPSRSPSRSATPSRTPSRSAPTPSRTTSRTPSRSAAPSYSRPSSTPSRSAPTTRSAPSTAPTDRGYTGRSSSSYSTRRATPTPDSTRTTSRTPDRSSYDTRSTPSARDTSRPVDSGGVLDLGNTGGVQPRVAFPRAYRGPGSTARDSSSARRPSFEMRAQPDGRTSPRFTSDRRGLSSSDLLTRYSSETRANPSRTAPTRDTDLLSARRRNAMREAMRPTGRDQSGLRERWLQSPAGRSAVQRSGALLRDDPERARRVSDASEGLSRATEGALRTAVRVGTLGAAGAVPIGDTVPPQGGDSGDGSSGDYNDGYDDGYDDGYYDGSYYNPYIWGYCNWYCGSPFWNSCGYYWGYWGGWGYGMGWCWGSYWNHYYYGLGYAWCTPYVYRRVCYPSYSVYIPPASYSTVVYRTIYADEEYYEEEYIEEEEGPSIARRFVGEAVAKDDEPEGMGRLNRAAEYYLVLGDRAFYEGRYGATVHYYAKAIEFAPEEGMLYLLLSDSLFATGDYSYAAFALRKAFELEPGLATNVVDKRILYADPDEFDAQLDRLEEFHADHPLDEDALLVLATNYLFSDRAANAVELLEVSTSANLVGTPAGELVLDSARAQVEAGR